MEKFPLQRRKRVEFNGFLSKSEVILKGIVKRGEFKGK